MSPQLPPDPIEFRVVTLETRNMPTQQLLRVEVIL